MSGDKECRVSREKYWREKSDAEKLETLRYEVKRLKSIIADQAGRLGDLGRHTHADGKIVVPMQNGWEVPPTRWDNNEDAPF